MWTCSPEKNSYKKTIFRSFSGHFQLLTVKWVVKWAFNWHIWIAFHVLLICHMTLNVFFSIFGLVTPLLGRSRMPPLKNFFRLWKYRYKPLSMPKFSFLSQLVWTCPPSYRSLTCDYPLYNFFFDMSPVLPKMKEHQNENLRFPEITVNGSNVLWIQEEIVKHLYVKNSTSLDLQNFYNLKILQSNYLTEIMSTYLLWVLDPRLFLLHQ